MKAPEASTAPTKRARRRVLGGGLLAVFLGALLLLGSLGSSPLQTSSSEVASKDPSHPEKLTEELLEEPVEPPAQPSPSVKAIPLGSGSALELTFSEELDAATESVFIDALSQALASGVDLPGRRIFVDLGPPQLQSTQRTGFSGWSCRLTAHLSLGVVEARHARAFQAEACELAARELAQKVAQKLVSK